MPEKQEYTPPPLIPFDDPAEANPLGLRDPPADTLPPFESQPRPLPERDERSRDS